MLGSVERILLQSQIEERKYATQANSNKKTTHEINTIVVKNDKTVISKFKKLKEMIASKGL